MKFVYAIAVALMLSFPMASKAQSGTSCASIYSQCSNAGQEYYDCMSAWFDVYDRWINGCQPQHQNALECWNYYDLVCGAEGSNNAMSTPINKGQLLANNSGTCKLAKL